MDQVKELVLIPLLHHAMTITATLQKTLLNILQAQAGENDGGWDGQRNHNARAGDAGVGSGDQQKCQQWCGGGNLGNDPQARADQDSATPRGRILQPTCKYKSRRPSDDHQQPQKKSRVATEGEHQHCWQRLDERKWILEDVTFDDPQAHTGVVKTKDQHCWQCLGESPGVWKTELANNPEAHTGVVTTKDQSCHCRITWGVR